MTPLHEFDPDPEALFDPRRHQARGALPARAVLCFFAEVMAEVTAGLEPAYRMGWEHGNHDVYVIEVDGEPMAVLHPGCGAPLAAANLDGLIALGCDRIVVCGGAGTLAPGLDVGHVIVVTEALRDEGTSYHYVPATDGRFVAASPAAITAIIAELDAAGVPHEQGRSWTTDGLFRETKAKVAMRRDEGCLTVEMEAAALFAVARFRRVTIGQLLYCGDDLSTAEWDHRGWNRQIGVRRHLFDLAVAACARLVP